MSRLPCLLLLVILAAGCETRKVISQSAPASQPAPAPAKTEIKSQNVSDFFEDGDRLSYQGYEVVKLTKKVKEERDVTSLVTFTTTGC